MVESIYFFEKTRSAFLWTRLLNIPFWAIFNMLAIILYKDLHATPFEITAIVAIKPIASLLSPYWSTLINQRQDRLVSNVVWANIFKFLPFLGFPWYENHWLFIASFGIYMAFARGVIPAWMEIIKQNIKGSAKERVFAIGSTIEYLGSAVLPLTFGWILDDYVDSWRWIFFLSALIGILSTLFLFRIPITSSPVEMPSTTLPAPLGQQLIKPWRTSWNLLRSRSDFSRFQIGFMLGGAGLVMIQTTLPMYFIDILHLSYTKILLAVAMCKGIGFAIASPLWVKWFNKVNIYRFLSWVTLLAALFPIGMLCAISHNGWLYASYLIYGIMQAGSELSWHLSGPVFAKDKESTIFSETNVLIVGIRGCLIPLLGNLIYMTTGSSVVVMIISLFLCLMATERMHFYSKAFQQNTSFG